MSPDKQTEWQISVEKRLLDLETAVFRGEKPQNDDKKAETAEAERAQRTASNIVKFVNTYWQDRREPLPMRLISARFSKAVSTAGGYLPTWLEELIEQKQLTVVETGTRRVVLPHGALELATPAERQSWGILSSEEREAIEAAQVELELRSMLRAEHKDG